MGKKVANISRWGRSEEGHLDDVVIEEDGEALPDVVEAPQVNGANGFGLCECSLLLPDVLRRLLGLKVTFPPLRFRFIADRDVAVAICKPEVRGVAEQSWV